MAAFVSARATRVELLELSHLFILLVIGMKNWSIESKLSHCHYCIDYSSVEEGQGHNKEYEFAVPGASFCRAHKSDKCISNCIWATFLLNIGNIPLLRVRKAFVMTMVEQTQQSLFAIMVSLKNSVFYMCLVRAAPQQHTEGTV